MVEAAEEGNSSNHVGRRSATIRRNAAKRIGVAKLTGPGGGKQISVMMAGQQIHAHRIRNPHMSRYNATSLKVKARKVAKVRRANMVKTRKAVQM